MKATNIVVGVIILLMISCSQRSDSAVRDINISEADSLAILENDPQPEAETPVEITIEKAFLYDQYTLEDKYPYNDTVRVFQWDKIKEYLKLISEAQRKPMPWGILQNRRNANGSAPLTKSAIRNKHNRMEDDYGVERHQSIPLYSLGDTSAPERYGRDGTLVRLIDQDSSFIKLSAVYFEGDWLVPEQYVHPIDTQIFKKIIFVDRTNQNITALEQEGDKWLVRSMNKATTGAENPPFQQETPLGIFVIQEKKEKMYYLVDGTQNIAGFSPYASRFSNGGYIHGVPVNKPRTALIETSPTLGTIPRSHMCVRTATSHAKFIYDWAPVGEALVVVIE